MKPGFDLNLAIENDGGLNPFYTEESQERFSENCNTIYIVDEAQPYDLFYLQKL